MKHIEQTIQVAGRMNVLIRRGGSGPPVLYLHGSGGLDRDSQFMDGLAQRYEVIQPAHPGWPGSDGLDLVESPLDVALHYGDLIQQLGLGPLPVIGYSIGGCFAAELAAVQTHLVSHLVLVASVGLWLEEAPVTDFFARLPEELPALNWYDPESPAAVKYNTLPEDQEQRVKLEFDQIQSLAAASKFLWPIPDRGLQKRLYRIVAPTLIIWGVHDGIVPVANAHAFARHIEQARCLLLEKASHCVLRELPQQCAVAVEEFIEPDKPGTAPQ